MCPSFAMEAEDFFKEEISGEIFYEDGKIPISLTGKKKKKIP